MSIYFGFKFLLGIVSIAFSFATLYIPTSTKLRGKKPGVILINSFKSKYNSYILLGGMTIILIFNQFAIFSSALISLIFVYKNMLRRSKTTKLTLK